MAALAYTARNISATQEQGAIIWNREAAVAITVGQLVYLNSSDKWALADGNVSIAAAAAVGGVVNSTDVYGSTSIAAGKNASVCIHGTVYGFSSLTPGALGWVSDTAGEIADAAGTYDYIVGQCVHADTFYVNPGMALAVSN